MSSILPDKTVMIDPFHPFYGGRRGVLEFALGKNQDVAVFTNPRETEDDPKIFFMVRRSDMDGISFPRTKSQEDFDEVAFAKALKDFEKASGYDEEDGATEK